MSAENACPHCGAPLPAGPRPAGTDDGTSGDHILEPEGGSRSAPTSLLAPGSHDEGFARAPIGARITAAEPDPILGEFVSRTSADADLSRPPAAGSSASFPALDFNAPAAPAPARPEGDHDDGFEDPPGRGGSLGSVLLASYASAITLALAWTLWQKPRDRGDSGPAAPSVARPASGHQAALSRNVPAPEPILAEHQASFDQPLRVGSLEVTPLEVHREGVTLLRTSLSGRSERRDGGKNALVLRLRLRNTSKDAVFAPLDQSYLREREKEVVDSFVETAKGERVYPYQLAVESEWSIPGQDFGELRPGEARVVSIVTRPEAPGDADGPFTWRVRLRTGINRTDVIGARWPESPAASK